MYTHIDYNHFIEQ